MEPWYKKYRPLTPDEVAGHRPVIYQTTLWLNNWKRGIKGVLIAGPPGIGKATIAEVVAAKCNYRIKIIDALDVHFKDIVGALSETVGIFSRQTCHLIKGAERLDAPHRAVLVKALRKALVPFVVTCDRNDRNMATIERACARHFALRPPELNLVLGRLVKIAQAEGFSGDTNVLRYIATVANGDLRNAITSLETWQTDKVVTLDAHGQRVRSGAKDVDLDTLHVTRGLFSSQIAVLPKIREAESSDKFAVAMLVHTNYPDFVADNGEDIMRQRIAAHSCAEALSLADIFSHELPEKLILSTVAPAVLARADPGAPTRIRYPRNRSAKKRNLEIDQVFSRVTRSKSGCATPST